MNGTQLDKLDDVLARLRATCAAAADWLEARVGQDGRPAGADLGNTWWRVPWALTLAGRRDKASALLAWVEAEALDEDHDLREGPSRGTLPSSPVYHLSHLAIAAHLLNRFDLCERLAARIDHFRDPVDGGIYGLRSRAGHAQEMLLTTQLGLLDILRGRFEEAGQVFRCLERVWQAQPELDQLRLYTWWTREGLILDIPAGQEWSHRVDFATPRQAFYHPGAMAAFLANYSAATGDPAALELARDAMQLNIRGTAAQFDDRASVQICKFGWGAAELLNADPGGGWHVHAIRMADWFIDRQDEDGSWLSSSFQLTAPPTDLDRMWKTAEHLMESELIAAALSAYAVRVRLSANSG